MTRILSLIFIVILFASGCQTKEPVKIGFVGGVTGINSSVAVSGRNAVLLAVNEANASGGINGHPIELVIKDDQEKPEVAAALDREFIRDGIKVVIGHYISGVAAASIEAIRNQDVLMISPTISARELSGIDDNFLRLIVTNTAQGKALAEYSAGDGQNTRTYVVYNNGNKAFVEGVTSAYRESFQRAGGEITGEKTIASKDVEGMQGAITEAIASGSDSFLLVMNANDVAMFAQQLHKTASVISIYSATWGMTADVIFQGGDSVEGIIFPAQFDSTSTVPTYVRFKETYEKLYGEAVDFSAVYSYETAQVVIEGLRTAASNDSQAIKAAILDKGRYQGLQADIVMDATGDVERPQFITTVKDGKFMTIGQVE